MLAINYYQYRVYTFSCIAGTRLQLQASQLFIDSGEITSWFTRI